VIRLGKRLALVEHRLVLIRALISILSRAGASKGETPGRIQDTGMRGHIEGTGALMPPAVTENGKQGQSVILSVFGAISMVCGSGKKLGLRRRRCEDGSMPRHPRRRGQRLEWPRRGYLYFGELIALGMKERGCVGALIDGGIRDVRWIGEQKLRVYARYRTAVQSIGRWRVTGSQEPVYLRGATNERGNLPRRFRALRR
jgi:hypothetical protein